MNATQNNQMNNQQQQPSVTSNSAILPSIQMDFEFNAGIDMPNFCSPSTGKQRKKCYLKKIR